MPDRSTIQNLVRKHLNDTLTEPEREQLRLELLKDEQPEDWKSIIKELHSENTDGSYNPKITDEIVDLILQEYPSQAPVISIKKHNILRWLSAAAIILFVGVGAYLWTIKPTEKPAPIIVLQQIINPGGQRATLTLSDGTTINLDSASNGQLATQGNSKIIKTSTGELVYESYGQPIPSVGGVDPGGANSSINPSDPGAGVGRGAASFNTMTTPRGGQYQLTLSDGTRVWLNAASSITYPTAFTSNKREVTITGEAYFEIAKNKSIPFTVKTNSGEIQVLGTAFNANTYSDESASKISLLEGSVKINNTILNPGEAYTNGKIIKTNVDQDISWKNGIFNFNNVDIPTMMRQLSRWYDIDVKYNNEIPTEKVKGKMGRNLTLQQVLRVLDNLDIKTALNGRTLTIESK